MTITALDIERTRSTKRLVALGLVITLGFSSILAALMWDGHERAREQAFRVSANLLAAIGSDIERDFDLFDLTLQDVLQGRRLPDFEKLPAAIRRHILFDRASTKNGLVAVSILDRNGNVAMESQPNPASEENFADRDFFTVHRLHPASGLFVSRPWQMSNGEQVMSFSRRLDNAAGEFDGIVVGMLRLGYFNRLIKTIQLSENDNFTVLRSDGTIIARSTHDDLRVGSNVAASAIFQRIVTMPMNAFEKIASVDGVKRLYVHRQIGHYPLMIVHAIAEQNVYGTWTSKAFLVGLVAGALCLINMVLIVSLAVTLRGKIEIEKELQRAANIDALTKLFNRRFLAEAFAQAFADATKKQTPLSLLMIDADHFKAYNDRFGHQAGDGALAMIAECIREIWQDTGAICARYGGEEFFVLLPGYEQADALLAAERFRQRVLARRCLMPDLPTVSIGVATVVPNETTTQRTLMEAADAALYAAKHNGRNQVATASQCLSSLLAEAFKVA